MFKNLSKIINNWDPLCLFPFAPQDEYQHEIDEIQNHYHESIDTVELSYIIFNVFTRAFGDTFSQAVVDCKTIASEILFEYNQP